MPPRRILLAFLLFGPLAHAAKAPADSHYAAAWRDALAFRPDSATLVLRIAPSLGSTRGDERRAAAQTLHAAGVSGVALQGPLALLLRDEDPTTRDLAARLLGDDRAQALARVPGLIADCRADSPTLRETAARQVHDSGLFPKPVTAALLRAVTARDMPAREGLLRALERAHAITGADPLLALQAATTHPDAATRAYARAALHTLQPADR